MKKILLDRLLMRPFPESGESWQGYLARLASDNELKGISQLANVLEVKNFELIEGKFDWDSLSILIFGQSNENSRSTNHTNFKIAKFCPHCIVGNKPIFRALWDRPLSVHCEAHECMLVDRCTACGSQVFHDRKLRMTCECGIAFSTMGTIPVASWVNSMKSTYFEAMEAAKSSDSTTEIERLAAKAVCYLTGPRRSGVINGVKRRITNSTSMILSDDFKEIEDAFLENPIGVSKSFADWYPKISSSESGFILRAKHVQNFEKISNALQVLRGPKTKGHIACWELPESHRHTHVRLSTFARLLRIPQCLLSNWNPKIMNGFAELVPCERTGKSVCVIRKSDLAKIQSECESLMNFDEAGRKLGIAPLSVQRLTQRGSLASPSQGYLERFVEKNALKKLMATVDRHATPLSNTHEPQQCLAQAIDELAETKIKRGADVLLRDIESGVITIFTRRAKPRNLADYCMRISDFYGWKEPLRLAA